MNKTKPVRIGIIGAGAITQERHLPGFRKIPGVRLIAVCNRSERSSTQVAKEWGFERIARSPAEIIRAPDIDAVVIGTWPCLHHTLSCAALRAGKHVFTQARMARDLTEAKQMVAVARRYSRQISMICPSPYAMKCALFVQELLAKGFVGKIRLVQFQSLNSVFANPQSPIHWRQQRRLNGINTLGLGIILERFLQWFGPIVSVQAAGAIFTPRRKNRDGRWVRVDNADQLQVLARFQDHPGQLLLSLSGAVHHAPSDWVTIYGDRGTLSVDMTTEKVHAAPVGEKGLKELIIPRRLQRKWTVESDLIEAIRAGGRSRLPRERTRFFSPDFEEGFRYMAVTEAVIRAAKSGRIERV